MDSQKSQIVLDGTNKAQRYELENHESGRKVRAFIYQSGFPAFETSSGNWRVIVEAEDQPFSEQFQSEGDALAALKSLTP